MFFQGKLKKILHNDIVVGELGDGAYVGKGLSCYLSGGRYEGDFVNGYRHGYGSYFFENGNLYEGNWQNDCAEGQGILFTICGEKYDGKWIKGRKHGFFLYKDATNNSYLIKYDYNQQLSKEPL